MAMMRFRANWTDGNDLPCSDGEALRYVLQMDSRSWRELQVAPKQARSIWFSLIEEALDHRFQTTIDLTNSHSEVDEFICSLGVRFAKTIVTPYGKFEIFDLNNILGFEFRSVLHSSKPPPDDGERRRSCIVFELEFITLENKMKIAKVSLKTSLLGFTCAVALASLSTATSVQAGYVTVTNDIHTWGSGVKNAFDASAFKAVAARYGVTIIDLGINASNLTATTVKRAGNKANVGNKPIVVDIDGSAAKATAARYSATIKNLDLNASNLTATTVYKAGNNVRAGNKSTEVGIDGSTAKVATRYSAKIMNLGTIIGVSADFKEQGPINYALASKSNLEIGVACAVYGGLDTRGCS